MDKIQKSKEAFLSQLEGLRGLKAGWLDGGGDVISADKLLHFTKLFEENYAPDLIWPTVFPTPEGCIQLEWFIGKKHSAYMCFLNGMRYAYFDAVGPNVPSMETTFSFEDGNEFHKLNEAVRKSYDYATYYIPLIEMNNHE